MTDFSNGTDFRTRLSGPFTRAQAIAVGVPVNMLRTKQVRAIFRGVYVWSDQDVTPLVRTRAALVLHPPAAFASHHSAARVHRLPDLGGVSDEHVSVFNRSERRPRPGIRAHLAMQDASVVRRCGVRVSHVLDTFLELASIVSLVDLVVLGDAIVGADHEMPARLIRAASDLRRDGCVLARRAAGLVRVGVDSPMETRLRMLLVLAGLPEPHVNHVVRGATGEIRRRFDLSYPSAKLIIEYDGRQHAESPSQWMHDILRREELDVQGWRLIVVTSEGIRRTPAETLRRVHAALRERRVDSTPRELDGEWRLHFSCW